MKNLLIILLFFLLPIDVFPQLILNDHLEDYYIDHIEIFQNKNPATPDSAIVSGKMNKYFSVLKNKNHVQLATPFWIKFDIENKSGSNKQWLVEFFDFKINSLIFYSSGNKQNHPSLEGGNQLPFSNKSLAHKNFTFPIQITQGKVKTFYVKIYSQKAISLLIVVRTFDEFVKYALQEYLILGIYYGIILLVILLNLFLYFSSKDKAYIYYIYYVLSIGFFSLTIVDGIAFQYLWPNHPEFNKYSVAFASVNMVVSALLYARTFLLLHLHHPRLDKIIIAILILRIFTFLTELIFNSVFTWNPFWDWVILLLPFSAGILCYKDGFTPAKYYVVAFTSIFLGYLIFALSNRGIIISNYLTVYAINYAVVIEIILLSLALAERLKSFKIEKEQAQKDNFQHLLDTQKLQLQIIEQLQENEHLKEKVNLELEEKVEERTQELLKARAEIEKINQILNADNTTLKSDVKTLKKDRVLQKQVSFDDFKSIYFDDPACFQFLETLKWGNGFKCKQCNHFKYSKGNTPNSRRCSKCGFIESVMTGSVFSRLKFPLHKAFYLLFLVHYNSKITSDQLSEILDLRKQTCWAFKKKILAIKQMAKDQKKHINSWNDIIPLDIPENF